MNKKSLLSFLGIITKSGNAVFGNDNVQYRSLKNEISLIVTACDISENSLNYECWVPGFIPGIFVFSILDFICTLFIGQYQKLLLNNILKKEVC